MFNLKPNKMEEDKKVTAVDEFSKIKNSLFSKMIKKNDYESCSQLSKMFDIFINHAGNEFARGLDKGEEIYK